MKKIALMHKISSLIALAIVIVSPSLLAASLTQDFSTKQQLVNGAIVSLTGDAKTVEQASSDNLNNMYGVVVSKGDLSFQSIGQTGMVSVANSGIVDTVVSNNAGDIKSGDPITVEDVAGVGEKATRSGKIIGIAQANFDGGTQGAKQFPLNQSGASKTISVGTIPVKLQVSEYVEPNAAKANSKTNRNVVLQLADALAGKQVKPYSLIIAALMVLIGIFISTFLITSSSYASMISIGRNPLSERKIIRSLIRMIFIAVIVFVTGLLLAYSVLKLS